MSAPREDFLLQPFDYGTGQAVWDFPLDDLYVNGIIQPTPYGESDEQHKIDIIVGVKGGLKQFPLLGFSLIKWLNGEFTNSEIFSSLSTNMKTDGYRVKAGCIKMNNDGSFSIDISLIDPAY